MIKITYAEQSGHLTDMDVALDEQHSSEAEVTEHPVESGAKIADHIRLKPRSLTVTGFWTNTIRRPQDATGSSATGADSVGARNNSTGAPDRVASIYSELVALQRDCRELSIQTSIARYDRMVLTKLSFPRDSAHANVLEVSLTFQEIIKADVETTIIKIEAPKPKKKKNRGKQATKKADAVTEDRCRALLAKEKR